jgi:hypothetical protein
LHVQVRNCLHAALALSFCAHDVVSRLGEAVDRFGVAVRVVPLTLPPEWTVTGSPPPPKVHVSSPVDVRKVRTLNVTASPARMSNVGA